MPHLSSHQLSKRERFLLSVRARELRAIRPIMGNPKDILEIGGGTGWQALLLQQLGHHVISIDTSHSRGRGSWFPVAVYDGHRIPFDDASFDLVFSSNVLEHIAHLAAFESEIHRVLRPGGRAVHVLPTSSWRIWTSLTHPFRILNALRNRLLGLQWTHSNAAGNPQARYAWYHAFWPNRHGEKGNSVSEIYWFSEHAWRRHFRSTGWNVDSVINLELFYTGQAVMNMHLPFYCRRALAQYLGSSTKGYLLTSSTIGSAASR